MKNKILSIAAFLLLGLLTSAWAGDLLELGNWILPGNWISKEIGRQGTVETVFSFKVDGTKLTGTVSDPQGETAISEGKINGDKISFVLIRGSGKSEMRLVYRGTVALNEIKFTLKAPGGTGQPQEFIARREFPRNGDIPAKMPDRLVR